MATAYRSEYVTLGGLLLGSRAIDCFDWADLLGTAKRHPGNFTVQGTAGRTARASVEDELEAVLQIRLNGRYDQDNARVTAGTERSNLYVLRAALMTELEDNATQTVQLTYPGGTASASCRVVDVRGPKTTRSPWIVEYAATLLLHGGALL